MFDEIHMTTAELAKRYGLTVSTIERWRRAGTGPKHVKVLGTILYKIVDVKSFEAANIRISTSEKENKGAVS